MILWKIRISKSTINTMRVVQHYICSYVIKSFLDRQVSSRFIDKSTKDAGGQIRHWILEVLKLKLLRFHAGNVNICVKGPMAQSACLSRNISSWQEANKQQHRNTEDYILMRLTDDNKQGGQFNGLRSRKHVFHRDESQYLNTNANMIFSTVKCRSRG